MQDIRIQCSDRETEFCEKAEKGRHKSRAEKLRLGRKSGKGMDRSGMHRSALFKVNGKFTETAYPVSVSVRHGL